MNGATRTGVLGGTFDPIHRGHLDAAEAARRSLQLAAVLMMPARVAPHRRTPPRASTYHRFAMIALAIAGREGLLASDLELHASVPSYTSLTLQRLTRTGRAPAQLFFITGADAFAEIATWFDYPAILDRCHFIVTSRPGHEVKNLREQLPHLADRMRQIPGDGAHVTVPNGPPLGVFLLDVPTTNVSSTEIRLRLEREEPLTGLVPPEVETYIRRHRLYRPGVTTADELHGPA